jgi:argonaute-like protein implicated in RNA metabolism and viral defense
MGSPVGLFTDEEIRSFGLSPEKIEQLKQEVLRQLNSNPEIRAIINKNPRLLTRDSEINAILRRETRPFLDRLMEK